MVVYKPNKIASRPILASDSPYDLPVGVVTTYDLGSGDITVNFPPSPTANDTVTLKNNRGSYLGVGGVNQLTVNTGATALVEIPGLFDTTAFAGPTGSFVLSHPRESVRWIYVEDTPNGYWLIDNDYTPGMTNTLISADYTLHANENVYVDTTLADVTITVPAGLPDDSQFTVTKHSSDEFAVVLTASGGELLESVRTPNDFGTQTTILLYQSESVTYVRKSGNWYALTNAIKDYVEMYYLPVTPIDLTPGASLLDIALHPIHSRSLLFESNVSGLLTVASALTFEFPLVCSIQVVFQHVLTANNADVWGRVAPVLTGGGASSIVVPIDAAFAHARSGTYGDTRTSDSLFLVSGGDTIGTYGEEVDSSSASTDITGMIVTFTT